MNHKKIIHLTTTIVLLITLIGYPVSLKSQTFEDYKKMAAQGDSEAQYHLGLCYEFGRGVARNRQIAIEWWQKAARQGHALAQAQLKLCHNSANKAPKDTTEETVTKYNLETGERTVGTINKEASRFTEEFGKINKSFSVETRAFIHAFAQVRTKDFTDPCCKYNNIFKVTQVLQCTDNEVSFKNPLNVKGIGWCFESIENAILNIYALAYKLKLDNFEAKHGYLPNNSEQMQVTTTDIANALVYATKGSLTQQEVDAIKETYLFLVPVYEAMSDPDKLKSWINKHSKIKIN